MQLLGHALDIGSAGVQHYQAIVSLVLLYVEICYSRMFAEFYTTLLTIFFFALLLPLLLRLLLQLLLLNPGTTMRVLKCRLSTGDHVAGEDQQLQTSMGTMLLGKISSCRQVWVTVNPKP